MKKADESYLSIKIATALKSEAQTLCDKTGLTLTGMVESALTAIMAAYRRDGFIGLPFYILPANSPTAQEARAMAEAEKPIASKPARTARTKNVA